MAHKLGNAFAENASAGQAMRANPADAGPSMHASRQATRYRAAVLGTASAEFANAQKTTEGAESSASNARFVSYCQ